MLFWFWTLMILPALLLQELFYLFWQAMWVPRNLSLHASLHAAFQFVMHIKYVCYLLSHWAINKVEKLFRSAVFLLEEATCFLITKTWHVIWEYQSRNTMLLISIISSNWNLCGSKSQAELVFIFFISLTNMTVCPVLKDVKFNYPWGVLFRYFR